MNQVIPSDNSDQGAPTGGTGVSCDTAEGAAQKVVAAWKANDRAGASACASDAAVTQLYSLPRTADMLEVVFQNCAAVDSANEDCVYTDVDGGFLAMGVSRLAGGWTVQWVTGHPD